MRRASYKRRLICSAYALTCSSQALGFQPDRLLSSFGSVSFSFPRRNQHASRHPQQIYRELVNSSSRGQIHPHRRSRDYRSFVSQRRIEADGSDTDSASAENRHHVPTRSRTLGLASLVSRVVRGARRRGADAPDASSNGNASASSSSKAPKLPPNQRDELERLRRENILLRETLFKLEAENEKLQQDFANRIVIETFEGEGKIRKAREEAIEDDEDDMDASFMLMSEEQMMYDDPAQWCDELEDGACPVEPTISFGEALRDRAYWLVGLLGMQSLSGIILARNEALLANHPVSTSFDSPMRMSSPALLLCRPRLTYFKRFVTCTVIYFLTMLVGAGGNAGNQASVRVIRGLALGTLNDATQAQFLTRELKMAVSLSSILSVAGFLRAAVFHTPLPETLAITAALAMIVFSSVCLGAILPLILKRIGVDPAHSSTTIQVVMDILGVILAVVVSSLLLDSPFGHLLVSRLSRG
jgi:Divalent cation transporter